MKLQKIQPVHRLNLTALLDMMTNILIFLIVIQSPDEAEIEVSNKNIKLPKASLEITKLPQVRLEIDNKQVMLNGKTIAELDVHSAKAWKILGDTLAGLPKPKDGSPRGIVVMSDQKIPYQIIDRAASQIARAGFSEVYFLSDKKSEEGQKK